MKKLLIFMLMLISTLPASAKVVSGARDSSGVKFGIRESFTLSNMNQNPELFALLFNNRGDVLISTRLQPGFAAGFALDIPVLESLHLNLELKYVMKGQRVIANVDAGSLDNDFTLFERVGYLELPIQPQFRLNFNENTHLNFNVGPYLAFALHAGESQIMHFETDGKKYDSIQKLYPLSGEKPDGPGSSQDQNYATKSDLKRFDAGLSLGLDLVVKKCHLGMSYDHGFCKINAKTYNDVENYIMDAFYNPLKNRSLYFTVGFDF